MYHVPAPLACAVAALYNLIPYDDESLIALVVVMGRGRVALWGC